MINGKNKKMNSKKSYPMANSCLTYYNLVQNYMGDYATQDRIRLIAVLTGELNYTFNEKSVSQDNTGLMLLPTYSHVNIHAIKPTKIMVVEINDELIKSVYANVNEVISFGDAINYKNMYVAIKYDSTLFKNIQCIHNEYIENSENQYLVELNILKLVYNLLKTEHAPYLFSIKARHPMEQVKYYIERNIKRHIKINDLAKIAGMNGSNFSNTFRRHYGTTPINYINITKMKLAEKLLKDSTVTEVAFDLGYENVSVFINQFKKAYDITPKQYQISNL